MENNTLAVARQGNLAVALEWCRAGYTVFPCDPKTKASRHQMPMTVEAIAAHWAKFPHDAVGILQSRTFAIDVDVKNGKDGRPWLQASRPNLPDTFEVETPSGGRHLIYELPEGIVVMNDTAGKVFGDGIDIKGNGEGGTRPGYVIAAETVMFDGGRYRGNGRAIAKPSKWLLDRVTRPVGQASGEVRYTPVTSAGMLVSELERHCKVISALAIGEQQDGFSLTAVHVGSLVRDGLDEAQAVEALVSAGLKMTTDPTRSSWSDFELRKLAQKKIKIGKANLPLTVSAQAQKAFGGPGQLPIGANPIANLFGNPTVSDFTPDPIRIPIVHKIGFDQETIELVNDAFAKSDVPIFNFADRLHLVCGGKLHRLNEASMRPLMAKHTHCFRFNSKGERVISDWPATIVQSVLTPVNASDGNYRKLKTLVTAPFMMKDGSIHNTIGYDPTTQFYLTERLSMPRIPDRPTRDDALAAMRIVDELIEEVCFATSQDRSAGIAFLLSAAIRPALDHHPLFFVSAPQNGAGKSYLTELLSVLQTGELPAHIAYTPGQPKELDKSITGAILESRAIISIDNVTDPLNSIIAAQAITGNKVRARPLGTSETVECDTSGMTFSVSGVNVRITGDFVRRAIPIYLDARVERAEGRSFERDPISMVRADRGKYLAAMMTILRARIQSGWRHSEKMAGFDDWNDIVRGTLLWIGMPDPWRSLMTSSPEREEHEERLHFLYGCQPDDPWMPAQFRLAEMAAPGFRDYFPGLYDRISSDTISPLRFGRWCETHKDRIAGGYVLRNVKVRDASSREKNAWRVEKIEDSPKWSPIPPK